MIEFQLPDSFGAMDDFQKLVLRRCFRGGEQRGSFRLQFDEPVPGSCALITRDLPLLF